MTKPLARRIRLPHVFVFLSLIIFGAAVATYFIPSGNYERTTKNIDGVQQTVVIPKTYRELPKYYSLKGMILEDKKDGYASPISLLGMFTAIPKGLAQSASLIFFIFIIGAVFSLIQETGTITAIVYRLMDKFKSSKILLPVTIFTTTAIGATTLGMGAEFIPMIPVFLLVSKELGYDRVFGVSFLLVGEGIGWTTGVTNPFNVHIAQQIAEVPIGSGILFRLIFFFICYAVGLRYFLKYGESVRLNPTKSVMKDDSFNIDALKLEKVPLERKHKYIVVVAVVLFVLIIYAVQSLGWGLIEMSGGFLAVGVTTIFICGMSGDTAMKAMIKGLENMIIPALIVGVARGIQVVMVEGEVIDTLLNHAANVLEHQPKLIAAQGMFVFQGSLNFLIPSASGQALVTMPLLVPLSDLLDLSRQLTVFIYLIGDGISNMVIPTNGFLMAVLGIAGVPFDKWLKFIFPLFLQLVIIGLIFIGIGFFVNY
jgi:uncharacterized ion transporter superfamily protein YfcC